VILPALCVAVLSCVAPGQSNTPEPGKMVRLSGRVVDVVNLPLPRTTVTLTVPGSTSPEHTVLTDSDGAFSLLILSWLSYEVRLLKPGFKSITIRWLKGAMVNDTELGTISLPIGETTEGPMFSAEVLVKPLTVC
jgi:hypothetical protein